MRALLSTLIVLLAVAIGALHFWLIFVLFRGNILGPFPRPPQGAPGLPAWPGILPLPQLFVLNLVMYLVLAAIFLLALRGGIFVQALADLLLILGTLATLWGWNNIRRPNPQGLGTWAVSFELALIALLAIHLVTLRPTRA
jgi:hypothetical protein